MRQIKRGILGGLIAIALATGLSAAPAAAAPPGDPAAAGRVSAENVKIAPGLRVTDRAAGPSMQVQGYPLDCTVWSSDGPYWDNPYGVPAVSIFAGHFRRGNICQYGKARLKMEWDGNLVVYDEFGATRWAASWYRDVKWRAFRSEFQRDGNFVMYDNIGSYSGALWASNTSFPFGRLSVQTDGNVVIYDGAMRARWATNTAH